MRRTRNGELPVGSRQEFQPLTREDRITVVLYRIGIAASTLIVCAAAYLASRETSRPGAAGPGPWADVLVYCLYAAVGMSVFFIHLYIGSFKRYLKVLYFISIAALAALLFVGKGSLAAALANGPSRALLLLPLSGCLGFVTAKEAFCFKLIEGYLLAMIMPLYLLLVSASVLAGRAVSSGLVLIAVMLVVFMLRKVFMPIAYDIGDKSAYQ